MLHSAFQSAHVLLRLSFTHTDTHKHINKLSFTHPLGEPPPTYRVCSTSKLSQPLLCQHLAVYSSPLLFLSFLDCSHHPSALLKTLLPPSPNFPFFSFWRIQEMIRAFHSLTRVSHKPQGCRQFLCNHSHSCGERALQCSTADAVGAAARTKCSHRCLAADLH